MKTYKGTKHPPAHGKAKVIVIKNGVTSDLKLRLDLINHSPSGFNWGYPGSGPAQLALALIADATGDDNLAKASYQRFKAEIITALSASWELTQKDIIGWLRTWSVRTQKSPETEALLDNLSINLFGVSKNDPICISCKSTKVKEGDFKDILSWHKFHIRRMCQACQDLTFEGPK